MKPAPEPRTESAIRAALTTVQILALTLWAEARGEGRDGLIAVGSVIRNRAKNPGWWGRSIAGCCLKRKMFSCWNPGTDANHQRLIAQANKLLDGSDQIHPQLSLCLAIAEGIIDGRLGDNVDGADHYFAPKAMIPPGSVPPWAKDEAGQVLTPLKIVGGHWFYRLGLDGKAA